MDKAQPPEQRRWKLISKFEADTWAELIGMLRQLQIDLECGLDKSGEHENSSVSGGYGTNWVYAITEKPDMTHERYFEELDAYLQEKKKSKLAEDISDGAV